MRTPLCDAASACVASREVRRPQPLPADTPPARYAIRFRDTAAKKSWGVLVRERKTDMTECWDHLAYRAAQDVPRKCKPLVGRFAKSGLRQYSVGPKQRVWYTISGREVTIRDVHRTHPAATD